MANWASLRRISSVDRRDKKHIARLRRIGTGPSHPTRKTPNVLAGNDTKPASMVPCCRIHHFYASRLQPAEAAARKITGNPTGMRRSDIGR